MQLRIGLHVGEAIVEGDDLFGDSVNIAARLQAEAEPGGIVASGTFRRHAEGRGGLVFDDIGTRRLKNVAEPMHPHRLRLAGGPTAPAHPTRRHLGALAALLAVAVALAGLWATLNLRGTAGPAVTAEAPAPPTVAVLPFENLSRDADQDYFADGLAEDLITDLSKIAGLRVVSRTSSFAVDRRLAAQAIAQRLNARFIVAGSVRRAGEQLRITANLVDAQSDGQSDGQLWAERFDGARTDVFGFQDQITGRIVAALRVTLSAAEERAVASRATANPAAYDAYLRGLRLVEARRWLDADANIAAQAAFDEATRLDPQYALAYAGLGWAKWLHYETINFYGNPDEAFRLAEKSLAIADNALGHRILARRHFTLYSFVHVTRDVERVVGELEAARALQPGDPDILADLATVLPFAGRPAEALALVRQAMETNPSFPDWYYGASGLAFLLGDQSDLAVRDLGRWSDASPRWQTPHLFLAVANGLAGRAADATHERERYLSLAPTSPNTVSALRRQLPMVPREEEIFVRGLRLAGFADPGT